MFITKPGLKNDFKLIFSLEDEKEKNSSFLVFAQETLELLNVKGDFEINVINDRMIILRNETACPCYNEFKADGCAVVEELINEIANQHHKSFTANFISCSKDKQSCCELLLQII